MLSLTLHHIGYLVKKKEKALEQFLNLGYTLVAPYVHDEGRGVDICFVQMNETVVELVCPFREDSIVSGLMARYKNSPYHICYTCDSLEETTKELRAMGYVPMGEKAPAPALGGCEVAFFLHSSLGMIELLEKA